VVEVLAGLGNVPIIEMIEMVTDATTPPKVCLSFRRWNAVVQWAGLFAHIDIQPVTAYVGEVQNMV
jgi:hypothetical protein